MIWPRLTHHWSGDFFAPLYLLFVGMHGEAAAVVVHDLDGHEWVIPEGFTKRGPHQGI